VLAEGAAATEEATAGSSTTMAAVEEGMLLGVEVVQYPAAATRHLLFVGIPLPNLLLVFC
jgi:hypothetical protein